MIKPALPHDETMRLQTLRSLHILDTEPEERFDRITKIARRLFDVPIALVSLVDQDRQWFKSRQGIEAAETPREVSFCGHAILDKSVFVVENASCDARFCDNPLVADDPAIRFYAGYPLTSPTGYRIGTLCIIDRKPREISEEDKVLLGQLGEMVAHELFTITLATTDELTKLSNRRGFEMIADQVLAICRRDSRKVAMMVFDLDNLKPINDTLGHAEGDRAIADFSRCLLQTFRESDLIARLGGDEFCVLLTDVHDIDPAGPIERLRFAVDRRNDRFPEGGMLQFSVGVAHFDPARHASVQELYANADQRMYERKRLKKSAG